MTFDPRTAYDSVALEQFAKCMPLMIAQLTSLPRGPYRSNWRVLHIDGFEVSKPIIWLHPSTFRNIMFDDIINEQRKPKPRSPLHLPVCRNCNGSGLGVADPWGNKRDCTRCDGTGRVSD